MEKQLEKILKWLIKYRSISQSKEQEILLNDIKNKFGGSVIDGNLIITKGVPKVAIVAHLDINQMKGNCQLEIDNDLWYSSNNIGPGFDDKTGIAFALYYLWNFNNIQIIFTKDEEIGCIGASKVKLDSNIKFLVQLDRRGFSDVAQYTNGIYTVNEDTIETLKPTLDKFGYHWQNCVYTDIGEIARNNSVQAVNISCGYYNEHSSKESLVFSEFINACNFSIDLINEINRIEISPLEQKKREFKTFCDWSGTERGYLGDEYFSDNDVYTDVDIECEMLEILDGLTLKEIDILKRILKDY